MKKIYLVMVGAVCVLLMAASCCNCCNNDEKKCCFKDCKGPKWNVIPTDHVRQCHVLTLQKNNVKHLMRLLKSGRNLTNYLKVNKRVDNDA